MPSMWKCHNVALGRSCVVVWSTGMGLFQAELGLAKDSSKVDVLRIDANDDFDGA